MKVALITATWRRYDMTRAFWIWTDWLRDHWKGRIDLRCIAAMSQPLHIEMAERHGVQVVEKENYPIGAKFNAALWAAREHEPDYVLIMGSDDVFCETVAGALAEKAEQRHPLIGLRDLYFSDLVTGVVGYWAGYGHDRPGEPAGCGRLIHRALLDRIDWHLWDDERNRGMDHSSFERLASIGYRAHEMVNVRDLGGTAIDCKTPDNIWTVEQVGAHPIVGEEREAVWKRLPFDVVAALPQPRDYAKPPRRTVRVSMARSGVHTDFARLGA